MRMGCGILGFWRRNIGTWRVYTENEENFQYVYAVFRQCVTDFVALLPDIDKTEKKIPANALANYRFAIRYKIDLMLRLCRWAVCCCEIKNGNEVVENQRRGASYLQEILDLREEFNCGKWQGWYDCDKRLNIPKRIAEISSYQHTENKED